MDIAEFKKLLEEEKRRIEDTLSSVGEKTTIGSAEDWVPTYPDLNPMTSEKSEMADEVEEFENRVGVEAELEERLNEVTAALARIQNGTYGKCEKGGEDISENRLRANPAARACIQHSSTQ